MLKRYYVTTLIAWPDNTWTEEDDTVLVEEGTNAGAIGLAVEALYEEAFNGRGEEVVLISVLSVQGEN